LENDRLDLSALGDEEPVSFLVPVPELTRSAGIQLNEQGPGPQWQSRQAIIFRLAALFFLGSLGRTCAGLLSKLLFWLSPSQRWAGGYG
jgi:hypothetical protein